MPAPVSRRSLLKTGAGLVLASAANPAAAQAAAGKASGALVRPARPLVLGHRGCCALRPEHTLASYAKAIADGADFIEPDLVATSDGILIARHENNVAETTDVASRPEFAARKTTKTIDGHTITGWFTEDFTLAEIKSLRARELLADMRAESHTYDGRFQIVSFDEIVDFVAAESATLGRPIGLIPELKHSTYYRRIGLPLEQAFLNSISRSGYLATAPVIVQSFELANLVALRQQIAGRPNIKLMQLVGAPHESPADLAAANDPRRWGDLLTPEGLAQIASYADWLAPPTRLLIPLDANGRLARPTGLTAAAHHAGLLVGTWTFRPENTFLPAEWRNGAASGVRNEAGSLGEIGRYLAEGIDGFFTDDPAIGRAAVRGASRS